MVSGQASRAGVQGHPAAQEAGRAGQIELTTTPYYHPILPLLLDKTLAREAMPDVSLPDYRGGYPEDAAVQVRRAVESHIHHFGEPPRGMWPSEGSVSQAMIPLLAEAGITWIATDEEILGCSTNGKVGRDSRGHVRHPELLYRRVEGARGRSTSWRSFFATIRCPTRSGFTTSGVPARSRPATSWPSCTAIGDACRHNPATLVPVILDGENCWEYYPDGGVSFLRSLYHGGARCRDLRPVKVGQFLASIRRATRCHRLFAGSWISHNFAIWIGHPEDNRGWDALHAARSFLVAEERSGRHDAGDDPDGPGTRSTSPRAPTGSGGTATTTPAPWTDCSTTCSASTCATSIRCWATTRPGSLFTPISRGPPHRPLHDQPRSFSNVKIDGRAHLFRVDRCGAVRLRQRSRDDDSGGRGAAAIGLVRLRRRAAADPRRHRGRARARSARRGRPAAHRFRRARRTERSW